MKKTYRITYDRDFGAIIVQEMALISGEDHVKAIETLTGIISQSIEILECISISQEEREEYLWLPILE